MFSDQPPAGSLARGGIHQSTARSHGLHRWGRRIVPAAARRSAPDHRRRGVAGGFLVLSQRLNTHGYLRTLEPMSDNGPSMTPPEPPRLHSKYRIHRIPAEQCDLLGRSDEEIAHSRDLWGVRSTERISGRRPRLSVARTDGMSGGPAINGPRSRRLRLSTAARTPVTRSHRGGRATCRTSGRRRCG